MRHLGVDYDWVGAGEKRQLRSGGRLEDSWVSGVGKLWVIWVSIEGQLTAVKN